MDTDIFATNNLFLLTVSRYELVKYCVRASRLHGLHQDVWNDLLSQCDVQTVKLAVLKTKQKHVWSNTVFVKHYE